MKDQLCPFINRGSLHPTSRWMLRLPHNQSLSPSSPQMTSVTHSLQSTHNRMRKHWSLCSPVFCTQLVTLLFLTFVQENGKPAGILWSYRASGIASRCHRVNLREPWQHEQIFPTELPTVMEGLSCSLGPLPSPVLSFCSTFFWRCDITYFPPLWDPKYHMQFVNPWAAIWGAQAGK